jgi:hypothetical protein
LAGEASVLEVSFDNVQQSNYQPNTVAIVDTSGSTPMTSSATSAAAAADQVPLGVIMDKAKTDASGTPVKSSAMNVRVHGIARVVANAAIAPGAYVGTATTAGRVVGVAAASGAHPILGIALNQAQAAGDQILVLLTPGVRV